MIQNRGSPWGKKNQVFTLKRKKKKKRKLTCGPDSDLLLHHRTSCYSNQASNHTLARDEILHTNSVVFLVDLHPSQVQVKCI